jgi:hypothetical protein
MLGIEEEGEAIDDNVFTSHVEIIIDSSLGY